MKYFQYGFILLCSAVYLYPKLNYADPLTILPTIIGEAIIPIAIAALIYLAFTKFSLFVKKERLFLSIFSMVIFVASLTSVPLIYPEWF